MMPEVAFTLERPGKANKNILCRIDSILCLGFAGRDKDKVQEHIDELRAIGVECPSETPVIYPTAGYLATTSRTIQVVGPDTGPEVEFAFLPHRNSFLVGLASDHTDRDLEKVDVNKSKQVCPKVLSSVVWDYKDLKEHWDHLILRSWVVTGGKKKIYQESTAAALISVEEIIERVEREYKVGPGTIILSGTIPALGGMVTPEHFAAALLDPIIDREIYLAYDICDLVQKRV